MCPNRYWRPRVARILASTPPQKKLIRTVRLTLYSQSSFGFTILTKLRLDSTSSVVIGLMVRPD